MNIISCIFYIVCLWAVAPNGLCLGAVRAFSVNLLGKSTEFQ
jgi:hypothetical protein